MRWFAAFVALAGCGNAAMGPPQTVAPSPIDVVVGEPVPSPPVITATAHSRPRDVEPTAPMPAPEPPPDDALPKTWTAPAIPGLAFADALRRARSARDAFERLTPPAANASATNAKEASMKAWFAQAQSLVDRASRMYAASFHAPDAPREGRIDAIAEAAELDMAMARSLDDAGLASLPVAWRADPAIASSFEDVAVGPTRRWRDEARVLARQCVDTARDAGVLTDAARRCAALPTGVTAKAKRAPAANGGCACSPGDPLCSASLGGWCGTPPPP